MKFKNRLVALNRESYVVLRTGVEAQQGPSYAQELVVFAESDATQHFCFFEEIVPVNPWQFFFDGGSMVWWRVL